MPVTTDQIDWRKPNTLLAEDLGVTPERVRQIRKAKKAPAPLIANISTDRARAYFRLLDEADEVQGWPMHRLAKKFGPAVKSPKVRVLARRVAAANANNKHPWPMMDFDLPTSVLAKIWRIDRIVFSVARMRRKPTKPRWRANGRRNSDEEKAFRAAVAAEQAKAAKFFEGVVASVKR